MSDFVQQLRQASSDAGLARAAVGLALMQAEQPAVRKLRFISTGLEFIELALSELRRDFGDPEEQEDDRGQG